MVASLIRMHIWRSSMSTPSQLESPPKPADQTSRRRRISLQMQFQIALGILFLAFCILTAYLIYLHEKRGLEQNALSKSYLVMAAVESTRSYIREVLRPKMYAIAGADDFVLEAMSTSYITRAVMDRFNNSLPEYQYRRVSINARNPDSTPTKTERELIANFDHNPDQSQWQGIRDVDGITGFVHARPVYMQTSCLRCHGVPDEAPPSLLERYGDERGFGYQEGDLAGVMVVSIPMPAALKKIQKNALSVFWVSLMMLTLLYMLISYLFNRVVVRSLSGVLDIFHSGLIEARDQKSFEVATGNVEIVEMTQAAQDMTNHLREARQALEQHAEKLESRVADRTKELKDSRERLRVKVTTRNRELKALNRITELITRSVHLADILPAVLEQALGLIPAKGAGIYLLADGASPQKLQLECHLNADKLAEVFQTVASNRPDGLPQSLPEAIWSAAQGQTNIFACRMNENCLNIPLSCRDRVLGVMTFVGVDFNETSAEQQALLQSVGHQIGITVESLQNIAALVRNKELLQSVFDGIPDVMVLLDRNLIIQMVNKAYLSRHGRKLEAILNRHCSDLEDGCDGTLAGAKLQTALETQRQAKEEVHTPAGEIFLVYYYPILGEDGAAWGVLSYTKDITLEKQVESRIQQTERMAAMGQLAAGVAHEINNPMGIILCYTDLIRRQLQEAPEILKDLEIIEKQAGNCQRIVADLLNFSRGSQTEPQPVDINVAILDVVHIVEQQFLKQGTDIKTELSAYMPEINLDVDRIKQVFLNLLMNAHQAMEGHGGRIVVGSAFNAEEDTVTITIGDTGSGVLPEIAEKIFDPFFSSKQTGEGTGLGLSVSYGIVQEHGGDIRMTSEPGRLTEFTITLPAQQRIENHHEK